MAVEEGVIEAVRMVLSGVARSESRIACGKNLIAQMLCGSNSAKDQEAAAQPVEHFWTALAVEAGGSGNAD